MTAILALHAEQMMVMGTITMMTAKGIMVKWACIILMMVCIAMMMSMIGVLIVTFSLLGYYGASILDFIGLQYITAILERLILFTYPTLTILIGVLFMGKRASRRELGALLLSYAGIGLAFAHDLHIAGDTRAVLIGAGFVLGSAVSYAFYQAGSEPAIRRLGAARFTALAMLVSTGATLLHFVVSQPAGALIQPAPVYLHALGMAVFSTVLPVFMASAAIRRIGASKTALIGTLGPILTIFFGVWLLDEPLTWWQMGGAALVLAGVMLISKISIQPGLMRWMNRTFLLNKK